MLVQDSGSYSDGLSTPLSTTSDDASAETLSNVVTKSDFNVILLFMAIGP